MSTNSRTIPTQQLTNYLNALEETAAVRTSITVQDVIENIRRVFLTVTIDYLYGEDLDEYLGCAVSVDDDTGWLINDDFDVLVNDGDVTQVVSWEGRSGIRAHLDQHKIEITTKDQ